MVLAAPETEIEYQADGNGWVTVGDAQGIGTGPVEGQAAGAVYRVLDPEGSTVTEAPVPSVPTSNGDPFAFDTDDPWPYRGMEEPSDPNIGVEANRLFVEADPSRGDGSWGERGLYAGDSDAGMSFLITLWTKRGEDAVVTTTWQRGDRAPEQSEQRIEPGQRIIQSLVPTDLDDGSVLLVALASPQADIGLEQPELGLRMDGIGDPGVGLWILDRGKRDGMIRLLDGAAEVYAEPVDVGPDAYS